MSFVADKENRVFVPISILAFYNFSPMGGFPTWTLIGMGVSAALAVIFTGLAYLAQSPNLLVRFRLAGSRLSQSGRRLTGLGLAATLVGGGFFMAGVPLGTPEIAASEASAIAEVAAASGAETPAADSESPSGAALIASEGSSEESEIASAAEPVEAENVETEGEAESNTSGAFSQPAQATEPADSDGETGSAPQPAGSTPAPTATDRPSQTPTATSTPRPTATPTPTPTDTPTPTITPTAINSETITVSFDGEITWVYRVPGNQRLELVDNGEQLLLESGRAMVLGITWQEVRLLDGRPGWIQLSLLDLDGEN